MNNKAFDSIIISKCPPKDASITLGYTIEKDGKLYYIDGENRVCLTEIFANTKNSVVDLVESTIKSDANCN